MEKSISLRSKGASPPQSSRAPPSFAMSPSAPATPEGSPRRPMSRTRADSKGLITMQVMVTAPRVAAQILRRKGKGKGKVDKGEVWEGG